MKLTTKIKIQKVRVIADYQRMEDNAMFAAILKYAYENDDSLPVDDFRDNLSGFALNIRMWTNILNRLTTQGYFKIIENKFEDGIGNYYQLTEFGQQTAQDETFFKSMKGELDIWLIKNPIAWLPHQIVKIEEKNSSRQKIENDCKVSRFKIPKGKILELKNATYRIEQLDEIGEFLEEEDLSLEINALPSYGEIKIQNLTIIKNEFSEQRLRGDFLKQKYQQDFKQRNQIIYTHFNGDIQFQRKVKIEEPVIGKIAFNRIEIKNVDFMAKTENDAEKWRLAWMRENVREYIFDNQEFEKLAYQIWLNFEKYYKLSHLTTSDFENYLETDKTNNFYQLMKIQAPQLLTY